MASFAEVEYSIYANIVGGWQSAMGGSEKVQNYADVIYGWSQAKAYHCMTMKRNVSRKHTSLTMISFEVNMSRFRNR